MRILILANYDLGLYKFRKELLEKLCNRNKVFVSCPYGDYIDKIREIGCKYIRQEFNRKGTNPFADFRQLIDYIRIIKKIKPNIVLTYTIKPNIYGGLACQLTNTPYITNITGLGTAVENEGVMQKITCLLYKIGLKKANMVFFQNKANCLFMLKRNIINKNYSLIPGSGVNTSHFSLIDYPNSDTVDFVFISRIMKEKGIVQYLNAAKYIRKKYPQTRFHICGSCETDYEAILKKYESDNIIIYHGNIDDVREIHKISQCTIHPSFYPEGMSNVLLESCACGRPIITTDRPGCGEIIDDGVNGFVVEQKNSKDLIAKIEMFMKLSVEERKAMGLSGRSKVEKEFNRRIVIDEYIKEIRRITG